jgi:hypothetical protein
MPDKTRKNAIGSSATTGFPGGSARLPRLNTRLHGGAETQRVSFVGTAFVRTPRTSSRFAEAPAPPTADTPEAPGRFTEYYTYESLFTAPPESGETVELIDEAAFEMLGLEADADWEQVVTAYRRIVKQIHPDRLVDATAEEVDAANQRLSDVNLAYSRLTALFRLVAGTNVADTNDDGSTDSSTDGAPDEDVSEPG